MKPERMVVYGDIHSGNLNGLTCPKYQSEDNGRYQGAFWSWWSKLWESLGTVDWAVEIGDAVDGPGKRDSTCHWTTNLKKQVDNAVRVMEVVNAKKHYMIRGTGYHTDFGKPTEDEIADKMGLRIEDNLNLVIRDRKFGFRHVVGRSDTPYGQYTPVGKELTNELLKSVNKGKEPATFLFRGHVHYSVGVEQASGSQGFMLRAYTTPALQLDNELEVSNFVRKLRGWLYHVGVLYVEIYDKDRIFVKPILYGG